MKKKEYVVGLKLIKIKIELIVELIIYQTVQCQDWQRKYPNHVY